MNPVIRCLIGSTICVILAGSLTWFFAEDIFSKQTGEVPNRVLGFQSNRPDLRLQLKP